MINQHTIIILDFETDSTNPKTCNPVQLACLAINPRTLEIIPNSEFNSDIRPNEISDENYHINHKSTIDFHAKNYNTTAEEVLKKWNNAPTEKVVWENFIKYLDTYHITQDRRSIYTAPLICGYNILGFDWLIIERLCQKYGNLTKDGRPNIFFLRDKIDLMLYCFQWFESLDEPQSYSLDTLREFFGMSKDNSHDALTDVRQTGELFVRFQRMIRKMAAKVKFKDSFKKEEIIIKNEK